MTIGRWSVTVVAAVVVLAFGTREAGAQGAVTSEAIAKANNPLADMNAINLQDYYTPAFNGSGSARANTLNVRGVIVTGRQVIRATLPVVSTASASGLGDLNVFDAFLLTGSGARTQFGVGPLLVIPTNTSDALGAGSSWQLGGAAVLVHSLPGGSLVGGLLTWQTDVVGGDNRIDTNLGTAQLFATFPIGGGWYVRSSPLAAFDFENDRYLVPFGLGVGKVFPVGGMLANAFVEPQVTAFYHGAGQPAIQIFTGLNLQFGG